MPHDDLAITREVREQMAACQLEYGKAHSLEAREIRNELEGYRWRKPAQELDRRSDIFFGGLAPEDVPKERRVVTPCQERGRDEPLPGRRFAWSGQRQQRFVFRQR